MSAVDDKRERRAERGAAVAFLVAAAAAVALGFVYAGGGQPQLEGLLLAVALGGIGVGLVIWANKLLPQGPVEEQREELPTTADEREAFEEDLRGAGLVKRRTLLARTLGLAVLALGGAAVFPIRSLGPSPGKSLKKTAWKPGMKLVDEHDKEVRADALRVGDSITVFPEGHTKDADAQAVIVRVAENQLDASEEREGWSPEGLLVYSKVCTHAGCPVGLYQADTHQLICPCHQSAFNVLEEAKPVFGPATRKLPQLPIEVGQKGELLATGDFSEPIGPAFWNLG
ncbi:MAG TPA: Rieske 2Fe-2S domain-containing protein [Acidimicrobiales bacterium]|nr:Rieske 2Fe-2S domain-containing protein [Acidimicrobiales bacterium]